MSSGACMTGAFPACPLNRCLGSCQKVLPTRHTGILAGEEGILAGP